MPTDGVRCQNPKCRAKLAESLDGRLVVVCRKCGQRNVIVAAAPAAPPVRPLADALR